MAISGKQTSTWIIIILVLINIATLATVWLGPKPSGPPRLAGMWQRELGLDDKQAEKFREHTQAHRHAAQPLFYQMGETKQHILHALSVPSPDTVRALQLADSSAAIHRQLEVQLIEHYLVLRALCTPEQVEKLNTVFLETLRRGPQAPPRQRRPPAHKK